MNRLSMLLIASQISTENHLTNCGARLSVHRIKVISVIGARPQFIKAAAICRAVSTYNASGYSSVIDHVLMHTGQHYDQNMSDVFFDELDIPQPDYNLGVGSASHGVQTGRMLEAIEEILLKEQPDWILVYGDTNSTLAGALAAVKLHIRVGHIEGGLRSFNRKMPEEINRVLTDHIATLIFCPTERAVENLTREGVTSGVKMVGDVMYDCALFYAKKAEERENDVLERFNISRKNYLLATVHRAENTDNLERLESIFRAFQEVGTTDCPIILPIHPRTAEKIRSISNNSSKNIHLVPPVSYIEMVALERNSRIILTDSGGIQKEAFFHGIPCVTLRDETEWVETIEMGGNILAGADTSSIVKSVQRMLEINHEGTKKTNVYGDGKSSVAIVKALFEFQA